YLLVYFDMESAVTFAHIHLGQAGTAGGVAAFLCGGGGKPACPAPGVVTFTGTLTAADVSTIATQGLTAGEFSEFVRAIQGGNAYVNVHTQTFGGGEIRGQLK
ncbi:MAG TPA: CHRD domain-containing protein, partial [Candidatus Limnocylindrales bacterium]|nr:CHRD domain-containing protein [Candidatus Limnocylindrales bacterium]